MCGPEFCSVRGDARNRFAVAYGALKLSLNAALRPVLTILLLALAGCTPILSSPTVPASTATVPPTVVMTTPATATSVSATALTRSPVVAAPTPRAAPTQVGTPVRETTSSAGFWHTQGTRIVDQAGNRVRIAALTWYGMESSYWVPAGLDYQPYTRIMDEVKGLGYNAIRLPYSNELIESDPLVHDKVAANRQFWGVHALRVLDALVDYARTIGLKIILDDHRCRAARPKTVNYLDEPRWYTKQYPESHWIADWQFLARRYLHNPAVIGFDLRNEPHTDGPGPWTLHAYLRQGSTWGPYNGVTDLASDWRQAAQRAGNASLTINSHLLMFVEGIQLYPASNGPRTVDSYWWSGILTPVKSYPVRFQVPHQLVYSPHDWGPWKWKMRWFPHMTYVSMQRVWHQRWSFILDNPAAPNAAPIWLGEFGTCTNYRQCVDDQRDGNQATWFHLLLRFLQEHPEVGWSFYALNGTNSNDHAANNGLLNPQWDGLANSALQTDLSIIQR